MAAFVIYQAITQAGRRKRRRRRAASAEWGGEELGEEEEEKEEGIFEALIDNVIPSFLYLGI